MNNEESKLISKTEILETEVKELKVAVKEQTDEQTKMYKMFREFLDA